MTWDDYDEIIGKYVEGSDMELYDALKRYYSTFKTNFPTAEYRGVSDEDMIAIIDECIERNKKYENPMQDLYKE